MTLTFFPPLILAHISGASITSIGCRRNFFLSIFFQFHLPGPKALEGCKTRKIGQDFSGSKSSTRILTQRQECSITILSNLSLPFNFIGSLHKLVSRKFHQTGRQSITYPFQPFLMTFKKQLSCSVCKQDKIEWSFRISTADGTNCHMTYTRFCRWVDPKEVYIEYLQ